MTMPKESNSKRTTLGNRTATKRPMVPEDLLRFQNVLDPQISPDASNVVFVKRHIGSKNQYILNLWMISRTTTHSGKRRAGNHWEQPRPFTRGGQDSHPRWSPDGEQIVFLRASEEHHDQLFSIHANGGEAAPLTKLPEGSIGSFDWSPDGKWIAISFRIQDPEWTKRAISERDERGFSDPPRVLDHWWCRLDGEGYFNEHRYQLYLVDTQTGRHQVFYTKDTLGTFTFGFSPDSRELVVATNPDRRAGLKAWNDRLVRIDIATGRTTTIANLPKGPKSSVKWSPDGRWIAYAGREGVDGKDSTENLELWVCDPDSGEARSLTGREDYCLMSAPTSDISTVNSEPAFEWSRDAKRIYMMIGWHGEKHLASVKLSGGPMTFHTRGARVHNLGNINSTSSLAAMIVGKTTRLDEIHVAELKCARINTKPVTEFNKALLDEVELSKPSSQWIRTTDGTKVQVWSMMPFDFKPNRKYPAVLHVHGGPHAQYGVAFFHEFQVLAAAGYAVFYSNPRGSKGYGRDHCASIRGRWGSDDWTDIQAVTEFVMSQSYVDTRRVGIMGGSYGGYMVNWAIGHSDVFAAAITDRCVSNLVSMFGSSDILEPPDIYWPANSWDRAEKLWQQSPLKYFGNVNTPTLILHSEGDLRCNISQAEEVFSALQLRNIPTRLVRYPGSTNHGLCRHGPPDLRVHRLRQILSWWKKYLQ